MAEDFLYALNIKPKSSNRYLWMRYYAEKRLIEMNYEKMERANKRREKITHIEGILASLQLEIRDVFEKLRKWQ
jgi:hypothetical protein